MRNRGILLLIVLFLSGAGSASCLGQNARTTVTIDGEEFLINGKPTYQDIQWKGNQIEGLLMNSRMVQGVFDDLNPETARRWKYPDTGVWDPDRNTAEFVRAMEEWKACGLLAFTINLQGGSPMGYGNRDWHNSAYEADGSLKPAYMQRLKMILDQAESLGMVPILGLFYFGQDQRLKDDPAVINATRNVIDWLHRQGYRNILIEVANECDNAAYDRSILKADRIHELIQVIRSLEVDGWRFPVSTSYNGGSLPRSNVLEVADFVLLHGNGVHQPVKIKEMVHQTRKMNGYRPMPILFNEDDHYDFDKPDNNLTAAVSSYASWGFFDFRRDGESYENGFQSVPVDWSISSDRKKAFFKQLSEVTGAEDCGQ
jgi:hypothetical protein